jgi:hypothetical protein
MQRPAYLGNRYESDPCCFYIFYLELPQESNDEFLTFPPGTHCVCIYVYIYIYTHAHRHTTHETDRQTHNVNFIF